VASFTKEFEFHHASARADAAAMTQKWPTASLAQESAGYWCQTAERDAIAAPHQSVLSSFTPPQPLEM